MQLLLEQNQAFEDGTIDVKNLNGSIDDFTTIAGDAASALSGLGDATTKALEGMLNVPQGFKLGAARFQATLDLAADAAVKAFQGPTFDPVPFNRNPIPLSPSITTGTGPSINEVTVRFEAGAIVQQPFEDSVKFAERVVSALRHKARSQSGDSMNFRFD